MTRELYCLGRNVRLIDHVLFREQSNSGTWQVSKVVSGARFVSKNKVENFV